MNFDQIIQYFNVGIAVILVLGALSGFFAGLFKSLYKLIVFVVLLLVGWFIGPLVAEAILSYDISSLFSINIGNIQLTTLKATLPDLAGEAVPALKGLLVQGTETYALAMEFAKLAIRIAFLIVWLILMETVFRFFFWIVYLIIRPKSRDAKGKRAQKSFLSRLGGMGVALTHTTLFVIMMSIPIAGLCSIGTSLGNLISIPEGEEQVYQLVFQNDGIAVHPAPVQLDPTTQEALRFMQSYRDTLSGKIGGFVQFNGTPLDVAVFDEILSVKYNETDLKLRRDLETGLKIFSVLNEETDGNITLETIAAIDPEILRGIVDELSTMEIISIALPVGIDYIDTNGVLDEYTADIDLGTVLEEMKKVDIKNEIKLFGNAAIDVLALGLLTTPDVNFFALDTDKVTSLFQNLGNSEILALASDVAVQYLLDSQSASDFLLSLNLTKNDLVLDNINWSEEIANFGNLYRALRSLNISRLPNGSFQIGEITEESVNMLSEAIYNSKLFSDNSRVMTQAMITTLLTPEYSNLFTIDSVTKQDFASILSLGMVLYNSGVLNSDFDPMDLLTTENIDKIATYLSNSTLIGNNIAGILEVMLSQANLPISITLPETLVLTGDAGKQEYISLFTAAKEIVGLGYGSPDFGSNLTGEALDSLADAITSSRILMHNVGPIVDYALQSGLTGNVQISAEGIDWETEAGKEELKALFQAAGVLLEADLINTQNLSALTEDMIQRLSKSLSASVIFRNNMSRIFNTFLSDASLGIDISVNLTPDDWTEQELQSLLSGVKIIASKTNIPEDLFTLSEEEVNTLLGSQLITDAIITLIQDYAKPEGTFDDLMIISAVDDVNYFWKDRYNQEGNRIADGEIRKLIRAAYTIFGAQPDFSDPATIIDLSTILSLTDPEITAIVDSVIVRDSLAHQIVKLGSGDNAFLKVNLPEGDPGWKDELRAFIHAAGIILGKDTDLNNISFNPQQILSLSDGDIDTILASRIMKDTVVNEMKKLGTPSGSSPSVLVVNEANIPDWNTEIKAFIHSVKILLGDSVDLSALNFSADVILDLSTGIDPADDDVKTILQSVILADTMIKMIRDLGDDGVLTVTLAADDSAWYDSESEAGEIKKLIRAAQELLSGTDSLNDPSSITLTKILNANLDTLLASRILSETAVEKIDREMAEGGTLNGTLVYPTVWNDTEWYGPDGELEKFLTAVKVIVGSNEFTSVTFGPEKFFGADRGTLLASRLVEASVIHQIDYQMTSGSLVGVLVYPSPLVHTEPWDDSEWYGPTGELWHFLDALDVILDGDSFENAAFGVDKFLGPEREMLLDSRLVEASVINFISKETKLIKPYTVDPYYYLSDGPLIWTESETDIGELRRFLDCVTVLGNYSGLQFTMTSLINTDFTQILPSRILEATIADMIQNLITGSGALSGFIAVPTPDYQWYFHANADATEIGTIRSGNYTIPGTANLQKTDLYGFLKSIQEMKTAGLDFDNITLQTITSADSQLLANALWDYSRVMQTSIATMLNHVLDISIPEPNRSLIPDFPPFTNKADVKDALDLMDSYLGMM